MRDSLAVRVGDLIDIRIADFKSVVIQCVKTKGFREKCPEKKATGDYCHVSGWVAVEDSLDRRHGSHRQIGDTFAV